MHNAECLVFERFMGQPRTSAYPPFEDVLVCTDIYNLKMYVMDANTGQTSTCVVWCVLAAQSFLTGQCRLYVQWNAHKLTCTSSCCKSADGFHSIAHRHTGIACQVNWWHVTRQGLLCCGELYKRNCAYATTCHSHSYSLSKQFRLFGVCPVSLQHIWSQLGLLGTRAESPSSSTAVKSQACSVKAHGGICNTRYMNKFVSAANCCLFWIE